MGRELVNCPSNLSLYLLFIIEKEKEKMAGPMPTATVTNFVKACCNEVNLKLINNCSGKYAENIIFWKYFFDLPVEQCHLT